MKKKSLTVVVGAQFGSEAKGHVTSRVLHRMTTRKPDDNVANVRVAGPNAGHCVRDHNGVKFAMRSLPVGFIYPQVHLHIAAGSEVEVPVLLAEIEEATEHGHEIRGRITIDPEATLLTEHHKQQESMAHLIGRLGSTGKGIGAARADRLMRGAKRVGDDQYSIDVLEDHGVTLMPGKIALDGVDHVVIEGTQGYGLGLHAGFYPQCTSSDARAIDFCAMAGTMPWEFAEFKIYAVARAYPIRVAGNSGPLKGETSWQDLGLPEEHTTVTKKVRRVGEWDSQLVIDAVEANGRSNTVIALTMADQMDTNVSAATKQYQLFGSSKVMDHVSKIQMETGVDVALVTTGEDTGVWL